MGKFTNCIGRRSGARKQAQQGKISLRLVEFAQPLIDAMQAEVGELSEEQLHSALTISATIWNCRVLEEWGRGSQLAEAARERLDAIPKTPDLEALIAEMLERKAKLFPEDMRAISDFEVRRNARGDIRVVAEGRLPSELMEEH
jgi:hypothetical protein